MNTWIKRSTGLLFCVLLGFSLFVYWQLHGSLPKLNGEIQAGPGLSAKASLLRDAQGVVTIEADSKADAAYALGFAHGQDRFFQMDIQRRFAAGELAALVGEKALAHDRLYRLHQLRARAKDTLSLLRTDEMALLESYTHGINRGRNSLASLPFEYLLLNTDPVDWQPADSMLVSAFMFAQMTSKVATRDYARELLLRSGGEALLAFIQPEGTEWDTALDSSLVPRAVLPSESVWSPQGLSVAQIAMIEPEAPMKGSNSWAVSGAMTTHGGALLANDPHLGFSLPHIWYRAQLRYPDDQGEMLRVNGVSLPGLPSIAIGSNGSVAWGMTNSAGDWADLIAVDIEGDFYQNVSGLQPLKLETEILEVRGGESVPLEVRRTEWGPLFEINGETYAYRWLAHQPEALNAFEYMNLDRAKTTVQATAIAQRTGISPFNILIADKFGDAAWSLAGRLPKRGPTPSDRVVPWTQAAGTWQGWLPADDYPVLDTQAQAYLWTANNRIVGGDSLDKIGHGQYELGTRGWLIEQDLKAQQQFTEDDMARMVANNKAVLMNSWRDHLLSLLAIQPKLTAEQKEAKDLLSSWSGYAEVSEAAYTVVKYYRKEFMQRINQLLIARLQADGLLSSDYDTDKLWLFSRQSEGPLQILRDQAPAHWLPKGVDNWEQWTLDMLNQTLISLSEKHGSVALARWGAENRLRMHHPLASALPEFLRSYLNMPADELDGDSDMPLAQHPSAGQSMRFIVSPGREQQAYLTMPAGQSGHPLSAFYRTSHGDWLAFKNTPLLPGPVEASLVLIPTL